MRLTRSAHASVGQHPKDVDETRTVYLWDFTSKTEASQMWEYGHRYPLRLQGGVDVPVCMAHDQEPAAEQRTSDAGGEHASAATQHPQPAQQESQPVPSCADDVRSLQPGNAREQPVVSEGPRVK